jgi:hypothetical protein
LRFVASNRGALVSFPTRVRGEDIPEHPDLRPFSIADRQTSSRDAHNLCLLTPTGQRPGSLQFAAAPGGTFSYGQPSLLCAQLTIQHPSHRSSRDSLPSRPTLWTAEGTFPTLSYSLSWAENSMIQAERGRAWAQDRSGADHTNVGQRRSPYWYRKHASSIYPAKNSLMYATPLSHHSPLLRCLELTISFFSQPLPDFLLHCKKETFLLL